MKKLFFFVIPLLFLAGCANPFTDETVILNTENEVNSGNTDRPEFSEAIPYHEEVEIVGV
jgi:hypothetical protein